MDCGEIPYVFYEALEDYCYEKDSKDYFSDDFKTWMENVIASKGADEHNLCLDTHESNILYRDGRIEPGHFDCTKDDGVTDFVYDVYAFEASGFEYDFLWYEYTNEAENILNINQVALLELPLTMIEIALREYEEEIIAENEYK